MRKNRVEVNDTLASLFIIVDEPDFVLSTFVRNLPFKGSLYPMASRSSEAHHL